MIRHDMEQGTDAWMSARLAMPTSSQFHRIITPKKLEPAKGRSYAYELLAEMYVGEEQDPSGGANEFMVRGTVMEPEAVAYYELQRDVACDLVGFCTTDDGQVGCSPDRLVGEDGLLEIKCPSAKVHVAYLLGENAHAHRCQVQGQMWVTGREWCDLLIYSPFLPSSLVRHYPDPEWIAPFEIALAEFLAFMEDASSRLVAKGLVPEVRRKLPAPVDRTTRIDPDEPQPDTAIEWQGDNS